MMALTVLEWTVKMQATVRRRGGLRKSKTRESMTKHSVNKPNASRANPLLDPELWGDLPPAPKSSLDSAWNDLPTAGKARGGDIHNRLNNAGVPDYTPQTTAGKYSRSV